MIRKYQNELIVLLAFLFLAGAVLFELFQQHKLESAQENAFGTTIKLEDTSTLKKLWIGNKTISSRLKGIESFVGNSKVKTFKIERNHADIVLSGLSGSELNTVVGKYIASTPVQIKSLNIKRDGELYGLELKCSW